MKRQIPRGDDKLVCPLHRKPMVEVCHRCPWWQQVRGRNPNTGEEIDRWECAVAILPLLLIETAKEVRQGAAATESFRNEMVKTHKAGLAALMPVAMAAMAGEAPAIPLKVIHEHPQQA